jgi:hypothetical protein
MPLSSKPIIAHNAYPTGCHHHKKKRGRKELLNEQISIQVNIQPNHCRPAVDPPTPAADSDVTRANNVGNTARVHITTISSARVANGSKNHAKSPKTLTRPHLLLIRSYVLVFSIFQANIFGLEREEEDVLSSCLASEGNGKRKNSLLKTLGHVTSNKATKINMK